MINFCRYEILNGILNLFIYDFLIVLNYDDGNKKFLKYKILIILYEIIIDISIVYLLIIDNEIKDMNRKYIKYNKGFVG